MACGFAIDQDFALKPFETTSHGPYKSEPSGDPW